MKQYQTSSSFLSNFAIKLLNRFLGILLVGFALNMGAVISVQAIPMAVYTVNVLEVFYEPVDNVTLTIVPINNPEFTTMVYGENGHFKFQLFEKSYIKINAPGFQEKTIEEFAEDKKGTIDLGRIKLQPLVATFSFNEQLLNIPVVFVLGAGRFSAKLRSETEGEQMMFILNEIEKVDYVIPNEATFTSETGIVFIPLVEVDISGTPTLFQVELLLDSQSGKFRLNDAKPLF